MSTAGLLAALGAVAIPAANAVADIGFELEGNAVSTTGDDWDRVCYQAMIDAAPPMTPAQAEEACSADTGPAGPYTAVSFVSEPNLNSSIFTGGGSKDPESISSWAWKDGAGGLPDKDNLLNAFAARYSMPVSDECPNGTEDPITGEPTDPDKPCEVLFFGSDRYDNSGDAHQAFWFFQEEIALDPSKKIGGGFGFSGEHRPGDILVISNFSNGGTTSTITVYMWDPNVSGNLALLETGTARCDLVQPGAAFCGIVNGADDTLSPWSFTDKSGNNTFLTGEFFEGGVNLSTLDLGDRCFASVAAETRSSTSTTATLKDFVLGGFGKCDTTVTTEARDGTGAAIPDVPVDPEDPESATVKRLSIGTGTVQVKDAATVSVAGISTWSGTLQYYLCGPEATACDPVNGTAIGDPIAVSNSTSWPLLSQAATVSSAGDYCWHASFTSATEGVPDGADDGTDECFTVDPVTPTLATYAGPSGDVYVGQQLTDRAELSGWATKPGTPVINPTTPGGPAGGTITFTLYGPSTAQDTCGPLVYTSDPTNLVADVNPGAPGNQRGATATSSTINAPGVYHWKATYSGDSPNTNGTSHNADCSDTNERVTVLQIQPTISTAQDWLPNDSATVSATAGGALAGSVEFNLWSSASCTGTPLYGPVSRPVSGASPQTVSTANTTYKVTSSTTVYWSVQYTSTNPAHSNIAKSCTEQTALTINNNN